MTTSDLAVPPWLAITIVVCVCGSAIWKGEWQERTVAIAIIAAWLLTILLRDYTYANPQWGGFFVTVINLALFVAVALAGEKSWPLWVAGFQLLAVITHLARILDPTVGSWAYMTAAVIWTYMQFAALAVGVWGCVRRRRMREAWPEGEEFDRDD